MAMTMDAGWTSSCLSCARAWLRPRAHSLFFGPQSPRCRPSQDPYRSKRLAPPRLQVGAGAQRLAGRWAQTCLHASSPPESVVETTGRDKINTFPESESALQLGKCFSLSQAGETERRVSKPKHAVHSPPRGRQWPARVPTGTERRAIEPLSSVSVLSG